MRLRTPQTLKKLPLLYCLWFTQCETDLQFEQDRGRRFITEFAEEYNVNVSIPVMSYYEKDVPYIAYCRVSVLPFDHPLLKSIYVNDAFWGNFSERKKRAVMFHELAHCQLHIHEHDDRKMKDGCAYSVMHTYMPSDYCIHKHWDHYKIDLHFKFFVKQLEYSARSIGDIFRSGS